MQKQTQTQTLNSTRTLKPMLTPSRSRAAAHQPNLPPAPRPSDIGPSPGPGAPRPPLRSGHAAARVLMAASDHHHPILDLGVRLRPRVAVHLLRPTQTLNSTQRIAV